MKIFLATLLAVALAGCMGSVGRVRGTGAVQTTARTVGAFHAIVCEGRSDLRVTIGSPAALSVEAQPNIADLIETTVDGTTLHVSERESYATDAPVVISATVPSLDSVTIRGSSAVVLHGITGPALMLSLSGASSVEASGSVGQLTLDSSGAGDARLGRLKARDAVVRVAGVGNAHVDVSGTLDVTVAGVGSVKYSGGGRVVHQAITGVGSISPG